MPTPFVLPGDSWIDVCARNGVWKSVAYSWESQALFCRASNDDVRWFVHLGYELRDLRCAMDDRGRVMAVGQHQATGELVTVHEADFVALPGVAFGQNSALVAWEAGHWYVWRMDSNLMSVRYTLDGETLGVCPSHHRL